ncbi:MAG: FAD-dependent oxidoreductase [Candidatus Omnitrophica bacterium]|nr:FAD-dependent oxidoreductase [Candidatus Omnitrophota bacterium]MDD5552848.1 FAD-dependent oxidoreductase [Candidatus Omnitrophota bacterium]
MNSTMNDLPVARDTVILGAGLAGLSASRRGGVIYEKERGIGGTCGSLSIGGYTFDKGIHVLHTKNKYVLGLLSGRERPGLEKRKRSAWIYSHGVLTKYPFQANTFGLPRRIISECLEGFIGTFNNPRRKYDNYEDWIYGAFGKGIADNFYLPYSRKFWTVGARELTTDWLDVRVPRPRIEQVIAGALSIQKEEFGPNSLFQYPRRGGIQSIPQALAGKNAIIHLGEKAARVDLVNRSVVFTGGRKAYFRDLISTIPLPELVKMIDGIPSQVKTAAAALRYNSVFCVNLGVKGANLNKAHWIYFPEDKFAPFRISFPRNFSASTVPKGWSSIQAEISYSQKRPISKRSITEKVVADLISARIIKPRQKVKLIGTDDIKYAYVIYDHQRVRNLDIIQKFLRRYSVYSAGRYGEWKYLWMDEAILSGRKAAMEADRNRQ